MADEQPPLSIIANPHAADVFADNAASFSLINGVVRITLSAIRPLEIGGPGGHVAIGQLVMPIDGAAGLAVGLYDFLKARGEIPSVETAQ